MKTTREKLIDATFEEIFSHGYQGASLSDILAKAGVHKGSMYHFFASKKEMALAAIKETVLQYSVQKYGFVETCTQNILEELYLRLRDTSTRDCKRGCPIAKMIHEVSNVDEDFNALMSSIYGAFRGSFKTVLDKAIETKELKPCNTAKLALFMTSAVEGAVLAAKASGNMTDYTDVIEELIEFIESKRYS